MLNIDTITDENYADVMALFANTPTQAEFLQQSLELVSWLLLEGNKTKYMTPLCGVHLKLTDKFTLLGISVSSTESEVNIRLEVWTAIDRLSIIRKYAQSDKIRRYLSILY